MSDGKTNIYLSATLAIAGFLGFSIGDAIVKIYGPYNITPFQISFIYACVGLIVLVLFSGKLGGFKATMQTKHRKIHAWRAALQAPTQALNFYAFMHMPLSSAYAVIFLAPVLTAAIAIPLLKEKPTIFVWLGILGGFAGMLMVVRPDGYSLDWPLIAVFATALITSVRNIVTRSVPASETQLSMAVYPIIGVIVAMALPTILLYQPMTVTEILWLTVGGALFGLAVLWTSLAFRYAPAAIAGSFHYSQILWGIAFGLFLFGHVPDALELLGGIVIIVSGLLLVWRGRLRGIVTNRNKA